MRVHPSQLKPGCLLIRNVMGQTLHPIIPKDTVIKPIHMKVLQQFLIDEVDVAKTLVNGETFNPQENRIDKETSKNKQSFLDYYVQSIKETKELFQSWKNRVPIDIVKIRDHLIPLLEAFDNVPEVIFSLQHFVDKQEYYYHHSVSTALLSAFIADRLNFSKGDRIQVALAAYLSDCGMAQIDDELLYKKASFTMDEYKEIVNHPITSYRMVEQQSVLKYESKIAILQHHERLDGSGYPFGLSGNKIHEYARILAVSDMFHAMTSERMYKKKQSAFKVIEEMLTRQLGKLDIKVVNALVKGLTNFSIGTKVKLSDLRTGEIIFIDEKHPTRPIIRLDFEGTILPLNDNKNLHIDEILSKVD